jgi:hypothetical protein
MGRQHVDHSDLLSFAQDRVNLQGQGRRVPCPGAASPRKAATYLEEHPDFTLKKVLLSGSLAKGNSPL